MHDKSILRHVKIQIYLHPSVMGMARHGVPDTSRLQTCHSHLQLTALHLARKNIFADGSVVGLLQASQLHLVFLFDDHHIFLFCPLPFDQYSRIGSVCGSTVNIKFCRIFLVCTGKCNVLFAHADVHSVPWRHLVSSAVHTDAARASDIDNSHLPSL